MEEENLIVKSQHIYESYRDPEEGICPVQDAVNNVMTDIQERQGRNGLLGIPSGYYSIDHLTNGWQRGEFIVIAGRASSGKTSLALNMARNAAVDNHFPTLYISLSESVSDLTRRLTLSESGLPWECINGQHDLEDYQWEQLEYKLKALHKAPLYFDDSPRLTTDDIGAIIQKLSRDYGVRLVFIDDIHSIVPCIDYRGNKEAEMSNISIELKRIAREQDVVIIAMARLSRSASYDINRNSYSKPKLSDLKDTSALENDADRILFIHRPGMVGLSENPEDREKATIVLAKNRKGETCDLDLLFKEEQGIFKELDEEFDMRDGSKCIYSAMNGFIDNDVK